jgi:hypothetical protein
MVLPSARALKRFPRSKDKRSMAWMAGASLGSLAGVGVVLVEVAINFLQIDLTG